MVAVALFKLYHFGHPRGGRLRYLNYLVSFHGAAYRVRETITITVSNIPERVIALFRDTTPQGAISFFL